MVATQTRRPSAHIASGYTVKLYVSDCVNCGVIFGITEELENRRRYDGKSFYCPNGHSMVFSGEEAKLKEELTQAHERAAGERRRFDAEKRSHAATKGQLTKTKKRADAGLCQYCHRTFKQLRRHMTSQHPGHVVGKAD